MISEFAVDPAAIGKDWDTFKKLVREFGIDKGRLISRFPGEWDSLVVKNLMPTLKGTPNLSGVTDRLKKIRADFGRRFNNQLSNDWLANAVHLHNNREFSAIVSGDDNINHDAVITTDQFIQDEVLTKVIQSISIENTASAIANVLFPLALISEKDLYFIDPYFDLTKRGYREPFQKLLIRLSQTKSSKKIVQIHSPSTKEINFLRSEVSKHTIDLIPKGYKIELHEWVDDNKELFHDRFFLANVSDSISVGLSVGHGFSSTTKQDKKNVFLLGEKHVQELIDQVEYPSTKKDKVGIIDIDSENNVTIRNE